MLSFAYEWENPAIGCYRFATDKGSKYEVVLNKRAEVAELHFWKSEADGLLGHRLTGDEYRESAKIISTVVTIVLHYFVNHPEVEKYHIYAYNHEESRVSLYKRVARRLSPNCTEKNLPKSNRVRFVVEASDVVLPWEERKRNGSTSSQNRVLRDHDEA